MAASGKPPSTPASLWGQVQQVWGDDPVITVPHSAPETQRAKLLSILTANAATAYGTEHRFEKLHTVADFQRAVPIATDEQLRPYIQRSAQPDQPPQLTAEPPLFYAQSGGASSGPRLLPVTRAFIEDYALVAQVHALCVLGAHARQRSGKLLAWVGNDAAGTLPNGVPYGALSGFLASRQPMAIKRLLALPAELGRIGDLEQKYYLALRLAVEQDVAAILLPNTEVLCLLADGLARWADDLIDDVRAGTLQRRYRLPPAVRHAVISRLKPNPRRADELAALRRENRGVLLPRQVWPRLAAISCWQGGALTLARQRLARLYGRVPIREYGYLSAEGWGSVPLKDDQPGGVLAINSAFFEFLPESELDRAVPERGAALTLDQLELGRAYGLVVTTPAGLYRFLTSDVVRVVDFYHDAPMIAFERRWEHVCSVVGERMTEPQVTTALLLAARSGGIELRRATATTRADSPGYVFTVDYDEAAESGALARLREELDGALQAQNVTYATARQMGTLGPPTLRRAAPGAFWQAMQARVGAGAPDGQVVLPHLSPNAQFSDSLAVRETVG